MDNMKDVRKMWLKSLCLLDNDIIYSVVAIVLVIYSSCIFSNVNLFISEIFKFSIIKLLYLLLIIYVSIKDTTIGILLGISYVVSLSYLKNTEEFQTKTILPTCPKGTILDYTKVECVKDDTKEENKESFFPFNKVDENEENNNENNNQNTSYNTKENCMNNYIPHYESVSNVCEPVSTFKNGLNAQGINSPEGFNQSDVGSPIV
jgi:hypothetical protein